VLPLQQQQSALCFALHAKGPDTKKVADAACSHSTILMLLHADLALLLDLGGQMGFRFNFKTALAS
jgi:hypothetical protein